MTQDPWWPDAAADRWLDALRIPTLPWVRPLLPLLGLPPAIDHDPSALETVYEQALVDRGALLEATSSVERFPGLDGAITREFVIKAMHRLGGAAAEAFERWARIHVVSTDVTLALFTWRILLLRFLRAVAAQDDPPPSALQRHRRELGVIFSEDRLERLDDALRRHAPPAGDAERELGLTMSSDALAVKEIVLNRWTLQALQVLGTALDRQERDELAAWANRRARALSEEGAAIPPAELLRYLAPARLFAKMPPAVSLPIPAASAAELAKLNAPPRPGLDGEMDQRDPS